MVPRIKIPKASERTKKGILFIIIVGSYISNGLTFYKLLDENKSLEAKLEKQSEVVSFFAKNLSESRNKSSSLQNDLLNAQEDNRQIQSQVETITSSVGVLEKLSKTDAVLLKKYSKVYFLNENYAPQKLSNIDQKYLVQKDKVAQIHTDVLPELESMIEDSNSAGLNLLILSAYRSFGTQESLKSAYKVTYGSGANKFSADQGYSEHQLGTTVDFSNLKNGTTLTGFEKTAEYKWLQDNAYKYGFVISYPKENTYYIFEPWHWRYVGINLATRIHDDNTYFYHLDQRDIDSYLINLF